MSPTSTSEIRPHDKLELALLSAWVDAADVGFCVIDDTSRVVMLNAVACRLLGVEGSSQHDQPLRRLFQNLQIDGLLSFIQWLGTPGFDGERRITRVTPEGAVHMLLKSRTLRADAGELFKVVAITDVSALTDMTVWWTAHQQAALAVYVPAGASDAVTDFLGTQQLNEFQSATTQNAL